MLGFETLLLDRKVVTVTLRSSLCDASFEPIPDGASAFAQICAFAQCAERPRRYAPAESRMLLFRRGGQCGRGPARHSDDGRQVGRHRPGLPVHGLRHASCARATAEPAERTGSPRIDGSAAAGPPPAAFGGRRVGPPCPGRDGSGGPRGTAPPAQAATRQTVASRPHRLAAEHDAARPAFVPPPTVVWPHGSVVAILADG